jgi:hypothetical protein
MRFRKATFFLFIGLLTSAVLCHAQVRKSVRSASFRQPVVSRNKAKIMCPIFETSQYPYQGIGFKMGDPFALTYKFYPNKKWAFAADGGKAASGLYSRYYRKVFNTYLADTLAEFEKIEYAAHKANSDWFIETKFLYQWDAGKVSKGLQLYAGLGWQWRSTRLMYDYTYLDEGPTPDNFIRDFSRNRFTYGPVGVLGFEYSYFSLPISAFIEIEWFTDVLLDPGYQRFQGGVGLRYVF